MNHHDPRRLAHHFPPFDESHGRAAATNNRILWQETMRAQRRLVVLVIAFWAGVAALVFVSRLNGWF